MNRGLLIVLYTLLVGLAAAGCHEQNEPAAPPVQFILTPEEQAAISSAQAAIAATADSILGTSDPQSGFAQMLAQYQSQAAVDSAWVTPQGLFVIMKKGGLIFWSVPSSVVIPPYDGKAAVRSKLSPGLRPSELIRSTRACLLNQQFNDEDRWFCRDVIDHLAGLFAADAFDVDTRNGTDIDLDFIESHLSQYGAVFYISHGSYDDGHTWIATGEEGSMWDLMAHHLAEWVHKEVSVGTFHETRGGRVVNVQVYCFSEKLIDSSYSDGSFPHSIIYLTACQGLKSSQLADTFFEKGAAVTVGWDETNGLGQSSGKLLFDALLGGDDLATAWGSLPEEARTDRTGFEAGAHLVYLPSEGGSVRLVDDANAALRIDSPVPDSICESRTVLLSGGMVNATSITGGTVELNGVATVLVHNGTEFSQPLALKRGLNRISIGCNGLRGDRIVRADSTIAITGSFSGLSLWTELRWNTNYSDVDFHLLPPGAQLDALWSDVDCFYGNKNPSWAGSLDVDDVDGYGPEHIVLPSVAVNGTYRLFIHYYDDHGAGASVASATVAVNDGPALSFGPYTVGNNNGADAGDLWEVCTITYPSGQITPVNQYYYLGYKANRDTSLQKN